MGFDGGLENVNYSESNPIDLILIEFFLDPTHFIISELHHWNARVPSVTTPPDIRDTKKPVEPYSVADIGEESPKD